MTAKVASSDGGTAVGTVFYLLLLGLVAAAIIGVFFGVALSPLTLPKDHTVVGAGPVSPGAEEAVSTATATTSPGDLPATIVASAGTAPAPDPTSPAPDLSASAPQVNSSAAAAEFVGPGEPTQSASSGSRVASGSPGLVVAVAVLTASSAPGDTGPAPTTVWSLGSVSRERATPKKTPMIAAATRPSRTK